MCYPAGPEFTNPEVTAMKPAEFIAPPPPISGNN